MLIWNCCHEILQVAQKLSNILDIISPICYRLRNTSESHIHLFRDCWESGIFWNFIFQRLKHNSNFNLSSFFNLGWKDWLYFNLSQDTDWKMIYCVAMWHICISRNNTVFEQKMKKPFSVYNSFMSIMFLLNKFCRVKRL